MTKTIAKCLALAKKFYARAAALLRRPSRKTVDPLDALIADVIAKESALLTAKGDLLTAVSVTQGKKDELRTAEESEVAYLLLRDTAEDELEEAKVALQTEIVARVKAGLPPE